jgi:transaldolase
MVERCDISNLPFFIFFFKKNTLSIHFFKSNSNHFMKFFIDTANLAQIQEANDLGILDGVTTNPSLMAKEGIKGQEAILQHYKDICSIVDGPVSAEVIATDFKGMVAEGEKLAALHSNIVVKIPMIKEGIKAIKHFSDNEIATNCTLVFSAGQALMAAKAGATMVSPFIGRIDDATWDGVALIKQIVDLYNAQGFMTEVLAASIRTPLHIVQCAEVGADICTCPLSSIVGLLNHPLTDIGLAKFLEDAKNL